MRSFSTSATSQPPPPAENSNGDNGHHNGDASSRSSQPSLSTSSSPLSPPPLPTQSAPLPVTTSSSPTSSSFLHSLGARLQGLRGKDASAVLSPSASSNPPSSTGFDPSKLQLPSLCPARPLAVLLACGSYSPPTSLHLLLFESARNHLMFSSPQLDIVGGLISPVHDAYGKPSLVPAAHRVEMCRRAAASSPWVATSAWETLQPGWSTTASSMAAYASFIAEAYPHGPVRLLLLCGADMLESLLVPGLWADEDVDTILGDYGVAVIERVGLDLPALIDANPKLRKHASSIYVVPQRVVNNVSSTVVRQMIGEGAEHPLPGRRGGEGVHRAGGAVRAHAGEGRAPP